MKTFGLIAVTLIGTLYGQYKLSQMIKFVPGTEGQPQVVMTEVPKAPELPEIPGWLWTNMALTVGTVSIARILGIMISNEDAPWNKDVNQDDPKVKKEKADGMKLLPYIAVATSALNMYFNL